MPDGTTHHKIWKDRIWTGLMPAIAVSIFGQPIIGIGVILGYLAGHYISPDLDLISINNDESRMMNELKVGGVVLVMLFIPYAYMMRFVGIGRKGHRNFFSHFPGVGTLIRIAWLLSLPTIAMLYWEVPILEWMLLVVFGLWIGLSIADLWHYIADVTDTQRKRRAKRGGNRRKKY